MNPDIKKYPKIEALINRTLQQCEDEGFTISDVKRFVAYLRVESDSRVSECNKNSAFKNFRTDAP